MPRRLWSATARLIAVHVAVTFLVTVLVLSVVYRATTGLVAAGAEQTLTAEIQGLVELHGVDGLAGLGQAIQRRLIDAHSAANAYLLVDAEGTVVAGNLLQWPDIAAVERVPGPAALGLGRTDLRLFRTDEGRWTVIRALITTLPGGERLLVGRDAETGLDAEAALGWALLSGLVAVLISGFLTGWGLTRFILGRIDEVSATARRVIAGDLSSRVPDRDLGNEFDRLAGALNAMFDRMEALIGDLRLATDSLAHDLRSPLTRMRNHLHQALDRDLPAADRDDHIGCSLREADETLTILAALLEIGRAEAGVGRDQFERVDVAALARNVADLFEPAAEEKGVRLDVGGDDQAVVSGHPQLLFLALSNLLDNAIRHAPAGSAVTLAVTAAADRVTLSVADRGPGIPAADRQRVLQRFVRLDASRSSSGAGLGLALVAAVARLHDAGVVLDDNAPGLVARLALPVDGGGAG